LSQADRTTINTEIIALQSEMDRVAATSSFNGISLLNAASTVSIQVGINSGEVIAVNLSDAQTAALGVNAAAVNTTDVTAASASLAALDTAIGSINSIRGGLGASQNRLQSAVSSIMNSKENLSAAESRIRDVDVAFETADLTRNSILQQAATSVLQQANTQPQIALSLLQG
jgi:flagellin